MPILSGRITEIGAVVDVVVDISRKHKLSITKNGTATPDAVAVRAIIDTGAHLSGFSPRLFKKLDLEPVGSTSVFTPSTNHDQPFDADLFDVSLSLTGDGRLFTFPDSRVMSADCWSPEEEVQALLGRDILNRCIFQYIGREQQFTLAY